MYGGPEGGDICKIIVISVVWQKLTQHCKAIALQLKINFKCNTLLLGCECFLSLLHIAYSFHDAILARLFHLIIYFI